MDEPEWTDYPVKLIADHDLGIEVDGDFYDLHQMSTDSRFMGYVYNQGAPFMWVLDASPILWYRQRPHVVPDLSSRYISGSKMLRPVAVRLQTGQEPATGEER